MKRTLHLLRSEPDDMTAELISAIGCGGGVTVVCLYPDPITSQPVDWSRLVDDILSHDRIICWW